VGQFERTLTHYPINGALARYLCYS
jgi:hypothetical protein